MNTIGSAKRLVPNQASGDCASVSAGILNVASGVESSASGGESVTVSADYNCVAGTLHFP